MAHATLKAMTRSKDVKLGHFIVEFATPGIGHILKAAGCDFVFFDMEHSGFSFETLKSAIRYFEAAGVAVIVRVPAQENDMLARACDMGAEGLIAPMISTVAQAQAMVDSVKYFPAGKRGVGLQMAHDNYRAAPVAAALQGANDRTTIFCLIETADGAANADGIAALDRRRRVVGRPLRSLGVARHSRRVRPSEIRRRHGQDHRRRQEAQQVTRPPGAQHRTGHHLLQAGLRFLLLLRRCLGAPGCACRRRQHHSRRLQVMARTFRVALSGDFRKADGSPTYPDFDLAPLQAAANVEMVFLRLAAIRSRQASLKTSTR